MTRTLTVRHPRLARAFATTFVALAALLAVVWVAPRASGAPPPGSARRPSACTRSRPRAMAVSRSPVRRPAARARPSRSTPACASPWPASPATRRRRGAAAIRLRTSLDGASWGPWLEAPLELAGEGSAATAFTDAVWTGPARFVQIAAVRSGRRGPSALTGVRIVAIDPAEDGGAVARIAGAAGRPAATVAGVGFAAPARAAAAAPVIVTRAEWGADESLRNAAPSYSPVKMAFVHHTASGNLYSRTDAPALVRGIYAYHTRSLRWNDIAYNFLVDRFGTIYEGRYGGVTRGVVGAHVLGFNTGSTGSLRHRHVHGRGPAGRGRGVARAPAGLEALHPRPGPGGDGSPGQRRQGQVRQGRHRHIPRDRRPPRCQLHRVPGGGAVRAAALRAGQRGQVRRLGGRRRAECQHDAHQPQRRRRAGRHRPGCGRHHPRGLAGHGAGRGRSDGRLLERRRHERGGHLERHLRRRRPAGRRLHGSAHRHPGRRQYRPRPPPRSRSTP